MKYKKLRKELEFYKELNSAGVNELRFEKMRNEVLINAMEEVLSFTNDKLAKNVLKNTIDRSVLDGLIHARLLFR